jgi:hypothetical protein
MPEGGGWRTEVRGQKVPAFQRETFDLLAS